MEYVLLIERHRLLRTAVKDLLAQSGCERVEEAADPAEGIHKVILQHPSVIILDTIWPEVNGLWLSRVLRELVPESKIVLLLDDSGPDYQEAARLSGADAFVAKSALPEGLMPILAQWTRREEADERREWSIA